MGWVDDLQGSLVGLDTSPLIYFIEEHPTYLDALDGLFQALDQRRLRAVTSTVSLIETLTRPLREEDWELAERYAALLLDTRGLAMVELTTEVAREAARLRAVYNLRTPDAAQLATALVRGASHFLTNDDRLSRVTELRVLVLDELP